MNDDILPLPYSLLTTFSEINEVRRFRRNYFNTSRSFRKHFKSLINHLLRTNWKIFTFRDTRVKPNV